ncbi:hypothetical protein EDD18DRAFT_1205581 [Armillaria luteobubalina]|uniref:Uncharacterized protein n=1 Tax=Armillaria luteobubalina TaxID=153913 RepID=A0AA39PAA2_9AGAR|nr:hypothetical protein EDD18DRAFT_1205581 [Armillaria luteobubalina]
MVEGVPSNTLLVLQGSSGDLNLPSSRLYHSLSDRDMSPLTDAESESYTSDEYTEDEGRTSDDNQSEDMIMLSTSRSGSNVTIGNKDTHISRNSTTAKHPNCSTGGNLPPSCTDVPQNKKVRDHKLYMQEEQCYNLWERHGERLGYRKQTMTESMSAYKTNVLAPLLKAISDEPDDVVFSARAMPSEEYQQLLFLGYPWLENRICNQKNLTFPGLWSLRAPVFDTACSKCRRGNIRCEARAVGASINDPAGRKKYHGLSCKYCLASNSRSCDAWMHCWDVPYPVSLSRDKPRSGLECMEGQLAVKGDMSDEPIPEKQGSIITIASPMPTTNSRRPPLFLDLKTCTRSWRENQSRLGYRERRVSESLDDYINNVLAPLRDAILTEPDVIVFSARAMDSHTYKCLLLLEYPWLEVTEAKYKYLMKSRPPSLEDWSLKAPVFDDACARCRRDNIRCEAKAIGVPVYDPQGHKTYAGRSLSCKYCAAIQASPCGAWMRCWGNSNPWVAAEYVMKNDLKRESVGMRIKSASELRTKLVQKQTVQKVQAHVAPRSGMKRSQYSLGEALKKDKEKWEKERASVHDSAVARSTMSFAGVVVQAGSPQPQSVPSTSSGKERLLDENPGQIQWIERSSVDVQMQDQELSDNLTGSSILDGGGALRIDEDCDQVPAVEGFDPFPPTAHPRNQRLSLDPVFPDPLCPQLICNSRDNPVHSGDTYHSNNPHNNIGSGKRSFETAFGVDTVHERGVDAQCFSHSLPPAESLRADKGIQQENIGEDFSLHLSQSDEAEESTSGDPIDMSLSTLHSLKETFIDVIRQLQVDKANLAAELEGFKMNSKQLEESEARYKQENSQLKAENRKLEKSLEQSSLKGDEADERVKLVYRILEETRRNCQILKG